MDSEGEYLDFEILVKKKYRIVIHLHSLPSKQQTATKEFPYLYFHAHLDTNSDPTLELIKDYVLQNIPKEKTWLVEILDDDPFLEDTNFIPEHPSKSDKYNAMRHCKSIKLGGMSYITIIRRR